jgi:hypothetical protein
VDTSELRARARQEADELGPQPPGSEADLWREERWGAVALLAGLADDDAELLRQAANGVTGIARTLLDGIDISIAQRALEAVSEALRPYETPAGILLDGAAWLVTATRP